MSSLNSYNWIILFSFIRHFLWARERVLFFLLFSPSLVDFNFRKKSWFGYRRYLCKSPEKNARSLFQGNGTTNFPHTDNTALPYWKHDNDILLTYLWKETILIQFDASRFMAIHKKTTPAGYRQMHNMKAYWNTIIDKGCRKIVIIFTRSTCE